MLCLHIRVQFLKPGQLLCVVYVSVDSVIFLSVVFTLVPITILIDLLCVSMHGHMCGGMHTCSGFN